MAINSSDDFYSRIRQFYTGITEAEAGLAMEIAEIRRLHDNTTRHGKITEVDPKKYQYRMEIGSGSGGEKFLSPWIPFANKAGPDGKMQRWEPPFKDQQMTMASPSGEWRQATGDAMTWSDENKPPSDSNDEHVQAWGKYKRTEAKDFSKHAVGDDAWHTVQEDHVAIHLTDNFVIWTDKSGCWTTKEIQVKKYPYKDQSPAGQGGSGGGGSGGGGGGGGGSA